MRVGISGHQTFDDSRGWSAVRTAIANCLREVETPLVGLSSLATGADQVFAQELLAADGELVVVLPFSQYRDVLPEPNRAEFDNLVARCREIVVLAKVPSIEAAYMEAGRYIVDNCDYLLAVWDGSPSRGYGGTADVVAYARDRGRLIKVIDASRWRRSGRSERDSS